MNTATLLIAIASNLVAPMEKLIPVFSAQHGHNVKFSAGSTGKFYAQIKNGAPFDILLSADSEVTSKLAREGLGVESSRAVFAKGKLVLWSPQPGLIDPEGTILVSGAFRHLAVANSSTAPYGRAAEEALRKLGLFETLSARLVRGENIAQTFQFVKTGNAELGFVALSQVIHEKGSMWIVPARNYSPLLHEALLLKQGRANPGAQAFLAFLKTPEAREILRAFGYEVAG